MRSALLVAAVVGFVAANPLPLAQEIDFTDFDAAPVSTVTGPAVEVLNEPPTYEPAAAAASAAAEAASDPASLSKRGVNDPCAPQPAGSGPTTSPDTPAAFLANPVYKDISETAPIPDGYTLSFSNLQGSTSASTYLGLYTIKAFDPYLCQQYCDAAPACYGFNLYIERDPTLNPADACPMPSSLVNYKCTLWGSQITAATATNKGQGRNQFEVVITGSNGYSKLAAPPALTNFTGPAELGGAINAPGKTFIGSKYYPGPYDPGQCSASCQATTAYDARHPAADGTYDACNFFNSYVLSKNGSPQGTYCGLYTTSWAKKYSTNYGQYRGSDRYTVSQSYGYTLTTQDSGVVPAKKAAA